MKAFFAKVSGLLIWLIVWSHAITFVRHEWGHNVAANYMGIDGYVEYTLTGGRFVFAPGTVLTSWENVVISLAGGLAVTFFWGVLWLVEHIQLKYAKCLWGMDTLFALSVIALWNFFYSFSEIRNWQIYGSLVGIVLAVVIALLLYGRRLRDWLEI